jgi:hypothetical protein
VRDVAASGLVDWQQALRFETTQLQSEKFFIAVAGGKFSRLILHKREKRELWQQRKQKTFT